MAALYLTKESAWHTLQPTALVNEAMLRVLQQRNGSGLDSAVWANSQQFLGIAAICMRRVLIDHARAGTRTKRGGGLVRFSLDESIASAESDGVDLLDLDDALNEFELSFPRHAQLVHLRCFAGLEFERIAEVCGITPEQTKRDWAFPRAWLKARLTDRLPTLDEP